MEQSGTNEFKALLQGYLRESLSPQELTLFFELAAEPDNNKLLAESFRHYLDSDLPDLSVPGQNQQAWLKLEANMAVNRPPVLRMQGALRWVAIVVCILGAAVAVYVFSQSKNHTETANAKSVNKPPAWLSPDHIGATLYLAGGESLLLNNQDKGVIAKQDDMEVLQSGGAISYSGKSNTRMYNEIRTGKGKLWQAVLPDQTVVWLNGGSSIKYPLQFAADTRSVEISGEVYFEVTHHADYPFQVKAGAVTVEDIGTSFNIKSLADDSVLKTTLVEGSVIVKINNQEATLSAGQQSVVSARSNEIRVVQNASLTEALAWKNGFFYFQNAALADVMKQLSDWYQVDVVYNGQAGGELFSGQIDKTLSLSDVLRGLQQPGVEFKLDSSHRINVFQR